MKKYFRRGFLIAAMFFVATTYTGAYFSDSVSVSGNTFATGVWVTPGRIVINEVLYDSIESGTDTQYEWVEFYNAGGTAIDMTGYRLSDGPSEGTFVFPSFSLNPGDYAVYAGNRDAFFSHYNFYPDFSGSSIALGNTGDDLGLYDASLAVIDGIAWGDRAFPGVISHPGVSAAGHSIVRSPSGADTGDCSVDFIDQSSPIPGA